MNLKDLRFELDNSVEKLNSLLREAGIGWAAVKIMYEKKSKAVAEHVMIVSDFDERNDMHWLISSANQLLGDDMEIVYRYGDFSDENIKERFYVHIITKKSAEKICEHFAELVSNQGIDPKYLEPYYPDKNPGEFHW